MSNIMKITGALAYLAAVFLNAFVDLGHKIIIQNTIFKVYDGQEQIVLSAVVNGLILLPFILLLSPSGFVADKYPKNKVLKVSAWAAVFITFGITACYYMGLFWVAFAMTLLLAIQSAFYSPAKYGYIRSLFGTERLAQANGLVQATTIVAILAGTVVFSIFFEGLYPADSRDPAEILRHIAPVGWLLVINAILELVAMYRLPTIEQGEPDKHFSVADYMQGKMIKENLSTVNRRAVIRLSIVGLATFWSVGQVMLAAFPAYAKEYFAVSNTIVIQGVLACAGLGIVLGSWLAARVSRHHIETGLIPVGALGVAASLWFLPAAGSITVSALLFVMVGIMGGLFIVPLNALIQFHAGEHEMGRVLAVNNWVQNLAMGSFLVLTALFAYMGFGSEILLGMIAFIALIGGVYTIYKLPQSLVRILLSVLMACRYRVDVQGMKNMPNEGGVLLLGNHISWVDWAIVQLASPRPVRFVMLKSIYDTWYLNWFFKMVGCVPIAQGKGSKDALATVSEALNGGDVVCIFPEGVISRTGHLAEFRRGFEKACDVVNDEVVIVPFYLRGLWGSKFSRSSARLKRQRASGLKRDLVVAFGEPMPKETKVDAVKRRVFELSVSSWQAHVEGLPTLANAWVESAKRVASRQAITDSMGVKVNGTQSLVMGVCLSRRIRQFSSEQTIGLLLPTTTGGMLCNMAAQLAGKTVVNLNYTASTEALLSAVAQSSIKTIYSSQRFIAKLEKRGINISEAFAGVKLIYVEDLKQSINKIELVTLWLMVRCLPSSLLCKLFSHSHDNKATAAILFSSGSEGDPKGVMLSHKNIMANVRQISDVLNMNDNDSVMASLPLFHAFGLTVTQFMPLIEGLPVVCHPDPTDVVGIAKQVAKHKATMMCGTSTFLRMFSRNTRVHPLMLDSLRVVVAGAERLNPEVRDAFQSKFGKHIYEGYGTTETTPVASVNVPDAIDTQFWQVQAGGKVGTVGMPLPGTSFRIVDPETYQELASNEEGMVLIGGVQVMQGYLHAADKTSAVIKEIDGVRWYVTGDKGRIDEQGFLTICDRYSRFAKLGGEMVSLSSVESSVKACLADGDQEVLAINIPDVKKGEMIILLHEGHLDPALVREQLIASGINPLAFPSRYVSVEMIPKLGSGKSDYVTARRLVLETA